MHDSIYEFHFVLNRRICSDQRSIPFISTHTHEALCKLKFKQIIVHTTLLRPQLLNIERPTIMF